MRLEIVECDLCGKDCSEYGEHVVVQYPYGGQKFLCIECANRVFGVTEENKQEGGAK